MLSDRELEVFELIGQGLPTREIAKRLHISSKTVDSHREHIKRKLGLDSGTDLLKHAIEWKQSGQ
jgi:DNA-binding CsgD family transcriptional regulator